VRWPLRVILGEVTSAVRHAPRFQIADAEHFAQEHYGLECSAAPLPSERDQNFHLRAASGAQFVLKIANSREALEVLSLQNHAMEFLASAGTGLRWPGVVRSRSGNPIVPIGSEEGAAWFMRLLTWIEGECLANVAPHTPELLQSLGRSLAETALALSGFRHAAAHRTLYWDLRHASLARPHLALLTDPQRTLVEPFLAAAEQLVWDRLPTGVIHGDANDYNILADAQGSRVVSILDFGDMVHTATVCDLAIALAYVMLDKQDPIAAAAQVVAGYGEVRPLSEAELDAVYPLAAARLAMSVCYAAYQSSHAPENNYLNITNAPAWRLLARLRDLPADWPAEVFRAAGPTPAELLARRRERLGPSLSLSYQEPLHITRGRRQYLYASDGRAYLDCVNNVAHVGHCHPRVTEAVSRQMALLNTNTRYLHEHLVEYAGRLAGLLPPPLTVVYLVSSGSEANELALRIARAHTGRDGVVVMDHAYHGNTNALVDISPYKFNGPGGRGKPAHVQVVAMGERFHAQGPCAAFFCETALSCAGQVFLPDGYLEDAYSQMRAQAGLCIADEVQTGFGRPGAHFWMFETQGVVPDIVTMGKPIGNGHPLGAVVTTAAIAASFANGMEYFSTYGGNPVSCAAGLAVLDVIREEGLQENARTTGDYLLRGLANITEGARGIGLFLGFDMPDADSASRLVNRMKDLGVLLSTDGPRHNVIKIKPPIVFSRDDADRLLECLKIALS
jgi:4-aminobutyrate aminotransferase-like enzyme/Ser/Thr protein kinase RdoA (MazF antagonist)